MSKKGFTLVELLVVISIIALLLSILMPSLNKVRNQARLLTDAANCKQMGTITALYQAANNGTVPFLLTKNASVAPYSAPAKYTFLSLALSDYSGQNIKLPTKKLDVNKPWDITGSLYKMYCEGYLPKFFKCPFVRGKAYSPIKYVGTKPLVPGSSVMFKMFEHTGSGDSYGPWIWPVVHGPQAYIYATPGSGMLDVRNHPYGPNHGYPKYSVLNWHSAYDSGGPPSGNPAIDWAKYKDKAVRWNSSSLKRVGASSFSEVTALLCEQGETFSGGAGYGENWIFNYKSHQKGGYGGTNVVFGDMHVGWVQGSDVGWN